eukprot:TRINITY_DN40228_c0_g1_i1.p1 TRINITY_DN40228_c0_g1~~TRINITY_DN40228_c0_g1_i1.p1  ORF type:complete len:253 (+),score=32.78 TRINITY_DN40228_c0_g1_i1:135-893(+)
MAQLTTDAQYSRGVRGARMSSRDVYRNGRVSFGLSTIMESEDISDGYSTFTFGIRSESSWSCHEKMANETGSDLTLGLTFGLTFGSSCQEEGQTRDREAGIEETFGTEQSAFEYAHEVRLRVFLCRVRMSTMVPHELNEEQAIERAHTLRTLVQREVDDLSFIKHGQDQMTSRAWDNTIERQGADKHDCYEAFDILDGVMKRKRSSKSTQEVNGWGGEASCYRDSFVVTKSATRATLSSRLKQPPALWNTAM